MTKNETHNQGSDKGPRKRRTCVKCRSCKDPIVKAGASECPGRRRRAECDDGYTARAVHIAGMQTGHGGSMVSSNQNGVPTAMPQFTPVVLPPCVVWMPMMPLHSQQQPQEESQGPNCGEDKGRRKSRTCVLCRESKDPAIQKVAQYCSGKNCRARCPLFSEDEPVPAKKTWTEALQQDKASDSNDQCKPAAPSEQSPKQPLNASTPKPQQKVQQQTNTAAQMTFVGPSMPQIMYAQQMQLQRQRDIMFATQRQMMMQKQMAMQFVQQQRQQQQQQTKEQGKEPGKRGPDIFKRKPKACVTCRGSEDENIRLQAEECPGKFRRANCPNKTASNSKVSTKLANYVSF